MTNETAAQDNDIIRYTLKMSAPHQKKLAALAKQFKISQAQILENMVDHIDLEVMAPIFTAARNEKVAGRESKKDLLKKLSGMDKTELAKLLEQVK